MNKIRIAFSGLLFIMLFVFNTSAQLKLLSGNSVATYVDRLPSLANSAQDAYTAYYPKGKKTGCREYEEEIQSMILELADRSEHQSRLLSMLANRYEHESVRYDFSKLKFSKDQSLDREFNDFNTGFLDELDQYRRAIAQPLELLYREQVTGYNFAEKELAVYREKIPVFAAHVKKMLIKLEALMEEKGYNTILDKNDATHPHFIQLLEVRGMMLYRVLALIKQVDGANQTVADMVDLCRNTPGSCK